MLGVLLVATVGLRCSLTAPLPPGAQPFQPPAIYARWWAMTEACSGRSAELAAVQWYRVPAGLSSSKGEPIGGYWTSVGNRIVIREAEMDDGNVVRHEMLHALLGAGDHRRTAFLNDCATVVTCPGRCAADADAWHAPVPDYLALPPDSLDVDARAALLPAESDGQRWVTLRITVRNPRDRAVLVAEPPDWGTARTYTADVHGPTGGIGWEETADDSSMIFFRPRETKSRLYELRVSSDVSRNHVPSGTVVLRGSYARRPARSDTLIVTP